MPNRPACTHPERWADLCPRSSRQLSRPLRRVGRLRKSKATECALWGNRSCGPGTRSCWRTRAWPDSMSRWPRGSGRGGYLRLSYWLVGHMVDVECLAPSLGSAKHQPKCAFALAKMSTSRVLGIAPIIAGASYPLEYEYSSEKPIAEKARSSSECNSYRIEAGATVGSRVERANAVQSERRLLTSMRSS